MSTLLIDAPHVAARRGEFLREKLRREFFEPLDEHFRLPITDFPLPACPAADKIIPSFAPGQEYSPKSVTINEGSTDDPAAEASTTFSPSHEATPKPAGQSETPNPESHIEPPDAAEADVLLNDGRVQERLRGNCPSRRNRDVFRAVVVENRPQRDVAQEFAISQPRVHQILKQVGGWLGRVIVDRDRALPQEEQLQYAENVTRMRYEHLYAQSQEQMQAAERDTTTVQEVRDKQGEVVRTITTRRQNLPRPGYLSAALRLISDRAKFEGIWGLPARRATERPMSEVQSSKSGHRSSRFQVQSSKSREGSSGCAEVGDATAEASAALSPSHVAGLETGDSYNPLSREVPGDDAAVAAMEDESPDYREDYERYGERFGGDYEDRINSYQTQVDEIMGPCDEGEDVEEARASGLDWMRQMDLRGAEAEEGAAEAIAQPTEGAAPDHAAVRRIRLIEIIAQEEELAADDADGYLEDYYDDATGRFCWDARFRTESRVHGAESAEMQNDP